MLLFFVGIILLNYSKIQLHNNANALVGNQFFDVFFKYITYLGDGVFAILVAALFLFSNVKKTIYILITYLTAGGISSLMKHQFFEDITRPHFYYQYHLHKQIKLIDGVDVLAKSSFPSGHALSAFALFFCLIFLTKHNLYKFIFFVLACLAAYSRVHLSQHWLVDVYVGSLIGVLFSVLFYFLFYTNGYFKNLDFSISYFLNKNKTRV